MKILVFSHAYVQNNYRTKWSAVRDAIQDGEVLVVTPTYWKDPHFGKLYSAQSSSNRLRFVTLRVWGNGWVGRYIYSPIALLRLVKREQPDVIHIENEPWQLVYLQLLITRWFVSRLSKVVCFSWWNTHEWKTPLRFPGQILCKLGLRGCDLLIVGNTGGLKLYPQLGYSGKLTLIPQIGVNPAHYYPSAADPELLKRYQLGGFFVVGFVGRLHFRKGVHTLLQALGELRGDSWRALIVGEGPEREALVQLSILLGLRDRIIFTGPVTGEQMPDYLRLMDILVLPSLQEQNEQFGRVLIEAMACGVIAIGSTSGEIPHVIGNPKLVFPIGDAVAMAQVITRIMSDKEFADFCRQKGLDRLRENYSEQAIALKLSSAYSSLNERSQGVERSELS